MKHILLALVIMFLAAPALPAMGGDVSAVMSEELKVLIDRNEPGLVIVDSRSRSQYEEIRIKGAISIPLDEMEQHAELPRVPKDARLVFYCSGAT